MHLYSTGVQSKDQLAHWIWISISMSPARISTLAFSWLNCWQIAFETFPVGITSSMHLELTLNHFPRLSPVVDHTQPRGQGCQLVCDVLSNLHTVLDGGIIAQETKFPPREDEFNTILCEHIFHMHT